MDASSSWLHLPIWAIALATCSNKEFDQCGGKGFTGPTCCQQGIDNCTVVNAYYSQCQPLDLCLVPQFGQCGGQDPITKKPWPAKKSCCPPSFVCQFQNAYYSQCEPNPNATKTCSGAYKQCGGKDGDGNPWGSKPDEHTCCIPGYECDVKDPVYFSICNPEPICSNARYGQCGGQDADGHPWTKEFHHDNCCPAGFSCSYQSAYFSQCKPNMTRTLNTWGY